MVTSPGFETVVVTATVTSTTGAYMQVRGLEVTMVTMVTRSREEFFRGLRAFEFVEEAAAEQFLGGTYRDVARPAAANRIGVGPPAHSVPTFCPHPGADRPISSDPEWPPICGDAPGLGSWEVSNPTATAPA